MRRPINRLVHIRIIKNNIRSLPPQLKRHLLQITPRRRLHNLPPHKRAPRKRNLLDLHVLRDRLARGVSEAVDDVHDAGREAGLFD